MLLSQLAHSRRRKFFLIHRFCNIIKANYGIYFSKLCLKLVFLLGSFVHYQRVVPPYSANSDVMCGQLHRFFVLEAIEIGSCLAKNQHFPAAVCEVHIVNKRSLLGLIQKLHMFH